MSNDVNINLIGKDLISEPANKASSSLDSLTKKASKSGKSLGESGRQVTKDWSGLGDLFSNFLPRGFSRTLRAFKSTQRQVGRLSKGFKALKGAIAATGIGALVVALGLIVDNWDSISSAIAGASDETEDLVKENQALVQASKDQLDNISATENILKLQGKTEEDILAMRMQATDEAIINQRILLDSLKQRKEEEVKGAERAAGYTKALVALVTLPLTLALGSIDAITAGLADLGLLDSGTNLANDMLDGITGMIFDPPDEVAEKADASIAEAEAQLQRLENTRAGYQLRKEKAEDEAEAKAQKKRDDAAKQAEQDARYVADRLLSIQQDMTIRMQESEFDAARVRREFQYEQDQAELIARGAQFSALLALRQQYDMDLADIDAQQAASEKAAQDRLDAQADKDADDALKLKERQQQQLVQSTSSMFRTLGQLAEENSETQKGLAIADILLNQAVAMANAIRGASEGAKDPISLAVLITTMVGGILSAFAGVNSVLEQGKAASSSVGRGSATRSGFADTPATPLPARTDTPEMQAFVVQTQLQGQMELASQLQQKTTF